MQRIPLKAQERELLGKKVKTLRSDGLIPGHVFGNKVETEHVAVNLKDFISVFKQAGETGLLDLKIGDEKIRPVMVRGVQYDPIKGDILHIDFYQVNLKEKVTVPVPLVLVGEEPELVHTGEAVVIQTLNEVEVEALPTDLAEKDANKIYLPETNTFDTWFSSGQWPFVTLKANGEKDFKEFYPTDVMETGYDILPFWVMRMMILGLYVNGDVPFKNVLLHGLVRDANGEKISKSKGNVIDPLDMASKYGTDALRMSLIWGALIENDIALSEQNIKGQRNFTNKLWNIGRFIIDFRPEGAQSMDIDKIPEGKAKEDDDILDQLNNTVIKVTSSLENFRFNETAESLYDFIWHKFADIYIEQTKTRRSETQPILEYVFRTSLELLHPFMPFITEELWQKLPHKEKSIMITKWPVALRD